MRRIRCANAATLVKWLLLASCADGWLMNPGGRLACWQPCRSRVWTGGRERPEALPGLRCSVKEVGAAKVLTEGDGAGDILTAIAPLLQKQARKSRNTRKQKPTKREDTASRGDATPSDNAATAAAGQQ